MKRSIKPALMLTNIGDVPETKNKRRKNDRSKEKYCRTAVRESLITLNSPEKSGRDVKNHDVLPDRCPGFSENANFSPLRTSGFSGEIRYFWILPDRCPAKQIPLVPRICIVFHSTEVFCYSIVALVED